uniref:Rhodopsin, GQ-coupled n=2 Tax=Cacopsylla melanoneura TaxID=428564 RepID=A0A8D8Q7C5_9HEMI
MQDNDTNEIPEDYCLSNSSFWEKFNPISREVHLVYGTFLLVIGVAGVIGNSLVLFVFSRYRRLKGPFSAFIINLAFSDLCTACLHFMPAFSSFQNQWSFGHSGCVIYAFGVGHFGLLSIVILSVIAVERYMVLTTKPFSGTWKITECGAHKVCIGAWIYVSFLTLPPLFGWSCYVPEGFLTSCSWDYMSRTVGNRAFYIYLLIFGFVLPVLVITYCYVFILHVVLAHGKEMSNLNTTGGGVVTNYTLAYKLAMPIQRATPLNSAVRTAQILLMLVICFLLAWTPYAVITFIGQFGDQSLVTPWLSATPAIFAKASVVYNPLIYGLSHPSFKSLMKQYMSSCTSFNMTTRDLSMSRGQSLRGYKGDVLSSPPDMGHPHDRRTRTRGFRKLQCRDFNSEPDQRSMAALISETGSTGIPGKFSETGSSVIPGKYRVTSPPHSQAHETEVSFTSHGTRTPSDYNRRATIQENTTPHSILSRNRSQTSFRIKFSRGNGREESVTLFSSRKRNAEEFRLQNVPRQPRNMSMSSGTSFPKSNLKENNVLRKM